MSPATPQLAHRAGLPGAYGIGLDGPWDDSERLLASVPADWPRYEVLAREGNAAPTAARVGPRKALLGPPSGGSILVDRTERQIVVTSTPPRTSGELIHPTLAHAGAIVAWWSGHESFHAGGFVVDGGAWGVLASRGGGKSSTLAVLAAAGVPIVADDLIVVSAGSAFVGPRALDLRPDAARQLQAGAVTGGAGPRERWRLELGPSPVTAPLRGWFVLGWGETVEARRLGGSELLQLLGAQRAVNLPPVDPAVLIHLASLPAWSVERPRELETLPRVAERVLELASR
jgi:hypothetical protein